MFDFSTPITGNTTLEAQWDCNPLPDLSQVLDESALEKLSDIVKSGEASNLLALNDELLVTYGDYVMAWQVVGFEDAILQDGTTLAAINLLSKYATTYEVKWSTGTNEYKNSVLRNEIITTYQSAMDQNFINCLAASQVKTHILTGGATMITYDKLYAPSCMQLNRNLVAAQSNVEGPTFPAFVGAGNAARKRYDVSNHTKSRQYWTRSYSTNGYNQYIDINAAGASDNNLYDGTACIVAACNFVGIM